MKIAFIGHGNVGGALADKLQRLGHEVTLATDDPGSESTARALTKNPGLRVTPLRAAVAAAETVFLATPFQANEELLPGLADVLAGKLLVDCTNPVGKGLSHGLGSVEAGSQKVQRLAPGAAVVKAFSIYGFENFEDNRFEGPRPAMLFCGDDASAKARVGTLVAALGWEPVDVGGLEQALHLEHMTLLWVRMVRMAGHSPHFVWAKLSR